MNEPRSPNHIGPYRRIRELGRGAMGAVYEVVHEQTGAHRALKVIHNEVFDDTLLERFRREAQAMAQLDHPNLARIHSAQLAPPTRYLLLELYTGGTLESRLAQPWPINDAVDLIAKLADGLAHAHAAGVEHRDIKPANVLFDDRGEPVLSDFGLARARAATPMTHTGELLGTPMFMAPEQVTDAKRAGPEADVFALGALLYRLLTGSSHVTASDSVLATLQRVVTDTPRLPVELRPELPAELNALCMSCLEKQPDRRPTAQQLRDALLSGSTSAAPGRSPGVAGIGLVLLALAAALGAAFAAAQAGVFTSSPNAPPPETAADPPRKPLATPAYVKPWLERLDGSYLSVSQAYDAVQISRLVWSEFERRPDGSLAWTWSPRRCSVWTGDALRTLASPADAEGLPCAPLAEALFAPVSFALGHSGSAKLISDPGKLAAGEESPLLELSELLAPSAQTELLNALLETTERRGTYAVLNRTILDADGELSGAYVVQSRGWASLVPAPAGQVDSMAPTGGKRKLILPGDETVWVPVGQLQAANGIEEPQHLTGTLHLPAAGAAETLRARPPFQFVKRNGDARPILAYFQPWGTVVGRLGDFAYLQLAEPRGGWQPIGWYGGVAWVRAKDVPRSTSTALDAESVVLVCAREDRPLVVRAKATKLGEPPAEALGSLTHGTVLPALSPFGLGPPIVGDWGSANALALGSWCTVPWGPREAYVRSSDPLGLELDANGVPLRNDQNSAQADSWRINLVIGTAGVDYDKNDPLHKWAFGELPRALSAEAPLKPR